VKEPSTNGISINPCSENSSMAAVNRITPNFSFRKQVTLKLPLMHQRIYHQLKTFESSSHNNFRVCTGTINHRNGPNKLIQYPYEFARDRESAHHLFNAIHDTFILH